MTVAGSKARILLTVALACLMSRAAGGPPGAEAVAQIIPNPIIPDQSSDDRDRVRGTFSGVSSPSGGVAGVGGGCLVYQLAEYPTACRSGAQCRNPDGDTSISGYCDAEDSELEGLPVGGTCWYKVDPEGNTCVKGQHTAGKTFELGPTTAHPQGRDMPVNWRVLTCQNLVERGCAKLDGVQGMDRIHRYGEITRFPD